MIIVFGHLQKHVERSYVSNQCFLKHFSMLKLHFSTAIHFKETWKLPAKHELYH